MCSKLQINFYNTVREFKVSKQLVMTQRVNQPDYLMTLVIVTTNKTNAEILQLMEDIQSGVKGRLAEYNEFIEQSTFGNIKHPSFEAMFQSFRDTHMSGYNIG